MTSEVDERPAPVRSTRKRNGFFAGSSAFGYELGRVEGALRLHARRVGLHQYEVWGGAEPHFVDLNPRSACQCDCGDLTWRGGPAPGPCKHMLRAMLAEGEPSILLAVAALVGGLREYAEELERRHRPRPIRLTRAVKDHVARRVEHPVAALTFARTQTGTDASVRVMLGNTGIRLGALVRDANGVAFVPEQPPTQLRAAA